MLNNFLDKFIFTNTLRFVQNNFFIVNIPFMLLPIDVLVVLNNVGDVSKQKEIYFSLKESSKQNFMPRFNEISMTDKSKLGFIKDFFSASGWGLLEVIDFDVSTNRAIIVLNNSPFVQNLKEKVDTPIDNIFRGVLAGVFSDLFKNDVDCVEVECTALNHNSCKFIIKPNNEFDLENVLVRNQIG